jgi:hypothetical protein
MLSAPASTMAVWVELASASRPRVRAATTSAAEPVVLWKVGQGLRAATRAGGADGRESDEQHAESLRGLGDLAEEGGPHQECGGRLEAHQGAERGGLESA